MHCCHQRVNCVITQSTLLPLMLKNYDGRVALRLVENVPCLWNFSFVHHSIVYICEFVIFFPFYFRHYKQLWRRPSISFPRQAQLTKSMCRSRKKAHFVKILWSRRLKPCTRMNMREFFYLFRSVVISFIATPLPHSSKNVEKRLQRCRLSFKNCVDFYTTRFVCLQNSCLARALLVHCSCLGRALLVPCSCLGRALLVPCSYPARALVVLGAGCVSSFSVNFWLQTHLLQVSFCFAL